MKTKQILLIMITSFFLLLGCSNNQDSFEESVSASNKSEYNGSSEIHREYPKEENEVLETFGAIATSIINGAGKGYDGIFMNQLISFHAYGPKFTEFNDGALWNSAENEEHERTLFGDIVDPEGVEKFWFQPDSLNVAVYFGNVANLTFISDFELRIGGELHAVENLITLLFVKTKGEWKMVHEHHSPVSDD